MNKSDSNQILKAQEDDQWDLDFDFIPQSMNSHGISFRYELNSDMIEDDQTQIHQFLKKKSLIQNNEGQRQFSFAKENIGSRNSKLSIQKTQKIHQELVVMVMISFLMEKKRQTRIKQWTTNPMKGNINKKKIYQKYFSESLSQSLEIIKWSRMQNIPKQKRSYYLGQEDILSIQSKSHLTNLIAQQIKQFQLKNNVNDSQNSQKYQQNIRTLEEYVITRNQIIDSQKFRQTIYKINMKENEENKKIMIENSLMKNLQINRQIDNSFKEKLDTLLLDQEMIRKINHLSEVDYRKKIIPHSQNCLEFLSPKLIFKILTSLKKLKPIDQIIHETLRK